MIKTESERDTKKQRPRPHAVFVRLSDEEYEAAQQAAADTGLLTIASLMRELAIGHEPVSVVDKRSIVPVVELRGDLRRAVGMLKQTITRTEYNAEIKKEVNSILKNINVTINKIASIIQRIGRFGK